MIGAVKHNLTHLADFSGRDGRSTFWWYVLFLVVVQYAVNLAASVPMIVSLFGQSMSAARSGAAPSEMTAEIFESMAGYMSTQMWLGLFVTVILTALSVAAFVRRLHDGGFTGWIAAIPVVTQLFSAGYTVYIFDDVMEVMVKAMDPTSGINPMAVQTEIAPWSMLSWVGFIVVIGFGVLKSQDGPNKYGEAPVSF